LSRLPVIIVGGPTAGGKSSLALALADRFDGTIINADSMQVYRDLEILTARPGPDALSRAPHRLYGFLDAAQRCSAGRWRELALGEIRAATTAGRTPIVVGGTGLYLRALISGLHRIPAIPAELRTSLNARLAAEGPAQLHAELATCDPDTAARLAPGDSQRIVRALEVFRHTGRGLTAWQAGARDGVPGDLRFFTIVLSPPREALYESCNARFAAMIAEGGIEEVERLKAAAPPPDCPLWKAVGVPPVRAFLAGDIDRERMIDLGRRDTRRYAKRQLTWLRHQIIADMLLETKLSEINQDEIFSEISSFLLTRL
jgi:tRNA dimethylallyltransferase